VCDSFLLVQA